MKYTLEQYRKVQSDYPIWGEPHDEEHYTWVISKVRATQECCNRPRNLQDSWDQPCLNTILSGTFALIERCIIPGEGRKTAYTCLACLDEFIDKEGLLE